MLVTGATGYVAGWIIRRLLESGVTVQATVRDPSDTARLRHLTDMAEAGPGRLHLFRAELLSPDDFADAMQGCRVVLHTASPFKTVVKDPQKELIEPAMLGTRNVLMQAAKTESVERVVLTSSCAAIYTDAADCADAPGGVLTEAIWNSTASLDHQPYSLSKTLAEQEAWRIAEGAGFRLVVVNPALIMGPAVGGKPSSESFAIMQRAGSGEFRHGAPRLGLGIVDVRDVAEAHLAAAFLPQAEGRNIIVGHQTDLLAALMTLQPTYGTRYPLPRRPAPKALLWLLAPRLGLTRKFVSRNINVPWRADNGKSRRELGMTYRPLAESMNDMFQFMIDEGYF
ncbi:NAD-dependent epimerase/dehydratase family protein [Paracoccus caeni]|uniref:NAD-dependent epimerase/dehydratase family protein n=1 Tax=Paracoccus caeni TaxID=657651 RepID=A0A934VZP6_9RHOB|nr:NAD-dependent epimerase/dehydratase family protein [Paracoccus caeni]